MAADLNPPAGSPRTARDLRFQHLRFGAAVPGGRLDLPDEGFERIGCSLVVSYLYDPLAALKKMRRVLAPGGRIVVSSMRRDFDPSKLYTEEARRLEHAGDSRSILPRLFEPFVTSGKRRGTGLGLVTVRNLVKAHGGSVTVEARSEEGGAAFTICLPCREPPGSGERSLAQAGAGQSPRGRA